MVVSVLVPLVLSLCTVTVPTYDAIEVGVKETSTSKLPPGSIVRAWKLPAENAELLNVMPLTVRAPLPRLRILRVRPSVRPTRTSPNANPVLAFPSSSKMRVDAARPAPEIPAVALPPVASLVTVSVLL